MQWEDYDNKLQNMIHGGFKQGIYSPTVDTTLSDLKKFQEFFIDKYERYEDMRPVTNQPGKIYATTKSHVFDSLEDIKIENLEFRPIFLK